MLNKDQGHVCVGDFCAPFADASLERNNCWRDWYTSMPIQWDFFAQAVSGADQLRQRHRERGKTAVYLILSSPRHQIQR